MDINKIANNNLTATREMVSSVVNTMGNAALHAMNPDNFEFYYCSLELLDSSGASKGFLTFNVLPELYSDSHNKISQIVKTQSGVVTLFNSSFTPHDISIQGTFGRKMRVTLNNRFEKVSNNKFFGGNLGYDLSNGFTVKTGYGMIKLLQKMINQSWKLDDKKKPCVMVFCNYSFNTAYIVEIPRESYSISSDNRIMWNYAIEMKAVAEYGSLKMNNLVLQENKKNTLVKSSVIAPKLTELLNKINSKLLW